MLDSKDIRYMQHALCLAACGLGRTWPNPSVGAVVVKDNMVVGCGTTARGGRPHAETLALAQVGSDAKDATLYVTLEPCAHHGQTPPCTDTIIRAGIKRVVSACTDPNPQVAGKGYAQLHAAGIEVTEGICEKEARSLNEGFFSVIERKRPFVTLKTATSLDGKITGGKSRWITGEASRRKGHWLRAIHDAILTGIGTVLADDPALTCRLSGREADSPQRVVMDSNLRILPQAKILPAWIITSQAILQDKASEAKKLSKLGAEIFTVPVSGQHLSLHDTLRLLAEKGITRLLVEAGSTLSTAFVKQGLVDRLYWFRAPVIIGENGLGAFGGHVSHIPHYNLLETERLGDDVLEIYDCPTS